MSQLALPLRLADHAVFDTFLAAGNEAAVDYLRSLAAAPPGHGAWVWGAPATGKSHLLQATCERFGDGAASVLLGSEDVIAEFLGSYSVTYDLVDHYRGAGKRHDYLWEERWVRDEGYGKIIPQAVNGLLDKLSLTMDDVDTLVYPCFFKAEHRIVSGFAWADGGGTLMLTPLLGPRSDNPTKAP